MNPPLRIHLKWSKPRNFANFLSPMWPCIFCEQFLQPRSDAFYGTLRTHKVDANDIGMVVSAESVDCAPVWQVRRFTRSICQVCCFEKRRPTSHEGISCTCKISEFIPSQFLVSSGNCNWGLMRSLRPLRWTKSKSKGVDVIVSAASPAYQFDPICCICWLRTWLTRSPIENFTMCQIYDSRSAKEVYKLDSISRIRLTHVRRVSAILPTCSHFLATKVWCVFLGTLKRHKVEDTDIGVIGSAESSGCAFRW